MSQIVIRESHMDPQAPSERLELTDELVAKIAKFNSMLTPDQVRADLLAGMMIYTNFSHYHLEEPPDREPKTRPNFFRRLFR